jgi:hypothetical protein
MIALQNFYFCVYYVYMYIYCKYVQNILLLIYISIQIFHLQFSSLIREVCSVFYRKVS